MRRDGAGAGSRSCKQSWVLVTEWGKRWLDYFGAPQKQACERNGGVNGLGWDS